jgi:hypothetical protein
MHLSNGRNERAARRAPPLLQALRFDKERIPDTARGDRLLILYTTAINPKNAHEAKFS